MLASVTLGKIKASATPSQRATRRSASSTEVHGGEGPRGPVVGAPLAGCLDQRPLDVRMAIEAEETVGAEVEQLPPPDRHAAMVVHPLQHQLLEVDVAHALQEQRPRRHEAVLAEPGREPPDGIVGGVLGGLADGLAAFALRDRSGHASLAVLQRFCLGIHPELLHSRISGYYHGWVASLQAPVPGLHPPLKEYTKMPEDAAVNHPGRQPLPAAAWYQAGMWMGCDFFGLLRLLGRHRFAVHPGRLPACLFDLWFSAFNTATGALQQLLLGPGADRTKLEGDPIFIIGHWRTGTTLLHELLAMDGRLRCPTTFECFTPNNFLISETLLKPWSGFTLPAAAPRTTCRWAGTSPRKTSSPCATWECPVPTGASPFPTNRGRRTTISSWTGSTPSSAAAGSRRCGRFWRG